MKILQCTVMIVAIFFCTVVVAAEKPLKTNVPATQQGVVVPQTSPAQKTLPIPVRIPQTPVKTPQTPVKLNSKILFDNATIQYDGELLLQATLLSPDGKPLGGQMVLFAINPDQGLQVGANFTDPAGVAKWGNRLSYGAQAFNLEPGVYVTEARFNGNSTNPPAAHRGWLTIKKAYTTFKNIKFGEHTGNQPVDEYHMKMGTEYRLKGALYAEQINLPIHQKNYQVAIKINGVFWKNCEINVAKTTGEFECYWTPPVQTSPVGYLFTFLFLGSEHYEASRAERLIMTVP